jgi:putative phage-type endonuclease
MSNLKQTIGGTVISAICGENPYVTPYQAWLKLTGQDAPTEQNEAMSLGLDLETPLALQFAKKKNVRLDPGEKGVNTKNPWFHYNPDFTNRKYKRLVSIKTSGLATFGSKATREQWGEEGTDQVPASYLMQENWYMQDGSLDWAEVSDLYALIAGRGRVEYQIPKDPELIEMMIEAATKFVQDYVEPLKAPPLEDRDVETYQKFIKRKYPTSSGKLIEATPEMMEMLADYALVCANADKAKAEREKLKANICAIIGPDSGIIGGGFKFTWMKNKDSRNTDWQELAKALILPDVLEREIPKFSEIKQGPRVARFTEAA